MSPRIAPLTEIPRLTTRRFRNCLDGVTDEQAGTRLPLVRKHAGLPAMQYA